MRPPYEAGNAVLEALHAHVSCRADDKLVGVLQVLLKPLDSAELRVTGPDGSPIPIAAVVANVRVMALAAPTS